MKKSEKLWLAAACVIAAFIQGWAILKVDAIGLYLLYIGIVGAVPFMLLNGIHGDSEGAAGVVGGLLFVLVNASIYYLLIAFILKRVRRRASAK